MSTGIGMSSCCLSGNVHEGNPNGIVQTIDSLPTYIAAPENGSRSKSIIFITDIFGYELKNVRLLADNYAKAGFYCYIPDLHQGDSLPHEFLQSVEPPLAKREQLSVIEKTKATATVGTTLPPWLLKHREAITKPLITSFIKAVRATPGTGKVGAIGFCWGGRYAILAAYGEVDAAFACHPALVSVPGDFEGVSMPLSIAIGTKDSLLDVDTVRKIKDILAERKGSQTEVKAYEDQVHGFALRSDWSSETDRKAMDDAENQGIEWFNKFLA